MTSVDDLKDICVKGAFVKKRYLKCPHIDKTCSWRLSKNHKSDGYDYLKGACYISGSFKLECPE